MSFGIVIIAGLFMLAVFLARKIVREEYGAAVVAYALLVALICITLAARLNAASL